MNSEGMPHAVEYLIERINASEQRLELKLASIELTYKLGQESHLLQHAADEKALILFKEELKGWRIEVNNVREQIDHERGQFATIPALESAVQRFDQQLAARADALSARIDPLATTALTDAGRAKDKASAKLENQWLLTAVGGVVGAILAAVALYLRG